MRQKLVIYNDVSERLRFELAIMEGSQEVHRSVRKVDGLSHSSVVMATEKHFEIERAHVVSHVYALNDSRRVCLGIRTLPLHP